MKATRRRSIGSTIVLLLAISAWQYYDEGRISWPWALLDQFQSATGISTGPAKTEERNGDPRSILSNQSLSGRVVDVKDGDTLILRTTDMARYTIRLHGIDTPEWDQPYGKTASTALSRLINGLEVTVQPEAIDDYGRVVARVFYENRNINLEMVRAGHAWWYKQYAKLDRQLADAETSARVAKSGLWSDVDPVPPWIWRRRH